eukprot:COSAG02_NODE_106_length_36326_cov_13.777266_29_plen_189_part_00
MDPNAFRCTHVLQGARVSRSLAEGHARSCRRHAVANISRLSKCADQVAWRPSTHRAVRHFPSRDSTTSSLGCERCRGPSTYCTKDHSMSMGKFENVVVHFKRVVALLQNAQAGETCKNSHHDADRAGAAGSQYSQKLQQHPQLHQKLSAHPPSFGCTLRVGVEVWRLGLTEVERLDRSGLEEMRSGIE